MSALTGPLSSLGLWGRATRMFTRARRGREAGATRGSAQSGQDTVSMVRGGYLLMSIEKVEGGLDNYVK